MGLISACSTLTCWTEDAVLHPEEDGCVFAFHSNKRTYTHGKRRTFDFVYSKSIGYLTGIWLADLLVSNRF
jgi:hypothetical protein